MKWMDELLIYIRGDRRGKRANSLEQAALSDPFLYEAMEGLSSVEGEHEKVLEVLNVCVRKNVERKNNRKLYYRWIAAASFLLVGGVAVWLLSFSVSQEGEELMTVQVVERQDSVVETEMLVAAATGVAIGDSIKKPSKQIKRTERKKKETVDFLYGAEEDVVEYADEPEVKEKKNEEENVVRIRGISAPKMQKTPERKIIASSTAQEKQVRGDSAQAKHENTGETRSISSRVNKKNSRLQSAKVGWNNKPDTEAWLQRFERYMADSIRYPEEVRNGKIEGEVLLTIRLNKQRNASRIKVTKGLSPACDKEAIRLVQFYRGGLGDKEVRKLELVISFYFKKRN